MSRFQSRRSRSAAILCACLGLAAAAGWSAAAPLSGGSVRRTGTVAVTASGASYRVQHWTTEDGLPQNRIGCIRQTRDGYLWIGTWAGLARFDGVRFCVFDRVNTPAMVSDAISSLAEDTDGTLWMATKAGLVSYRSGEFRRLTTQDGLPEDPVSCVAPSRSGGVWLRSRDVLLKAQGTTLKRVVDLTGRFSDSTVLLAEDATGQVHLCNSQQWLVIRPDDMTVRTNATRSAGEASWQTARINPRGTKLMVGTDNGLMRIRPGGEARLATDALAELSIQGLWLDHSGRRWVNIFGKGPARDSAAGWELVSLAPDLDGVSVHCLEEDFEGSFWLGTEQGLVQLRYQPFRTYTTREGLHHNNICTVCESRDGAIWAGGDRGLSALARGAANFKPVRLDPSANNEVCHTVWPRPEGGIWAVLQIGGLIQVSSSLKPTSLSSSYSSELVMTRDHRGLLWLGGGKGAVAFAPDKPRIVVHSLTNVPVPDVHSIFEDKEGTLWLGTKDRGLIRWRKGTQTTFTRQDGLSHNNVWCPFQDSRGVMWFGTDNGLTRYQDEKFFPYYAKEGLLEGNINCILEDDSGHLWLSGLQGIYRIPLLELDAVAAGRQDAVYPVAFGTREGMELAETNGGENQPAGWKASDGRLWFPTPRGVVVVDPKSLLMDIGPPPVVLESVLAGDKVIWGEPAAEQTASPEVNQAPNRTTANDLPVRLSAGTAQVIEFHFTANTFVAPEYTRFRYRLKGGDGLWQPAIGPRIARYLNLPPGNYEFEVTAANHNRVWNPIPAKFRFTVAPHFWQTWFFYVACAGGLVALAMSVQAYRLKWQRRVLKLEEQRAVANERARIARDLHDDLGTALTGLALELDVVGRDSKTQPVIADRLSDTADHARHLAERMREVVWTVNPKCDTVSSLADFLEQQVSQFLDVPGLKVRLDFPENIPPLPLPAEARHELALSVREALNNVVRHAEATAVTVSLLLQSGQLILRVSDNGQGFRASDQVGQGLVNMRTRIEQVHGRFECHSEPGKGTSITFRVPVNTNHAGSS